MLGVLLTLAVMIPTPGSTYTRVVCNAPPAQWTEHVVYDALDGADGIEISPEAIEGNTTCSTTPWEQSDSLTVSCTQADWTSQTVVLDSALTNAEGAGWADYNGDGRTDVCAVTQSGLVRLYLRPASGWTVPGNWTTVTLSNAVGLGKGWMQCKGADMNGDGRVDAVIGGINGVNPGALAVMLQPASNPGTGTNWTYNPIIVVGRTMGLQLADIDGDNDIDIVSTDREASTGGTPGAFVLWNTTPSTLTFSRQNIATAQRMMFTLGDLDGDGEAFDFVTGGDSTTWLTSAFIHYSFMGTHVWVPTVLPEPANIGVFQSSTIVDIDLDTYPDIAMSFSASAPGTDSVLLWLKGGPPWARWGAFTIDTQGTKSDNIQCTRPNGTPLDINYDGAPDCLDAEQDTGGPGTGMGVRAVQNPCI